MSDSLHHSSNADKEREKNLGKAVWNLLCDPLSTKSTRATWAQCSCSRTALRAQGNPKTLQGHICAETGWRCLTQHTRDTLGVLTARWGFFPTPICHNQMTVGTYFSIPHEVWNPKSSKELLWQLPRYLWEPALHLFKPCWSHVPPQQGPDFLQNISTLCSQPS